MGDDYKDITVDGLIEIFIEEIFSVNISQETLDDAIKSHRLCEKILDLL